MIEPGTETPSPEPRRSGVQVISRAAAILHMLARAPTGLTLAEVVKRSGLAKSTAYRILSALEQEQIVESFDGRYRVGRILTRSAMSETEQVRAYPELPAYDGSGDPTSASSYHGQISQAVQQPTPWLGKFDSTTMWCSSQGTDCYESSGQPPWSVS